MNDEPMIDVASYGRWALIVGGSEGIGASLARRLARQGFDIVLIARKAGPMQELADELTALGAAVRFAPVDLGKPDALERTRELTDDIEVGLLLFMAGANETRGNFLELDPAVYRGVVAVNVIAQMEFTRHYGARMLARGRGGVVLTGSLSNFCGAATLAPYVGAKAFSRVFTESLWAECAGTGIDVLHVVVGYTDTPAMRRLGLDTRAAQAPDDAAVEILANLRNGPLLILGGEPNLELATRRSRLDDRAGTIRGSATPRREDMAHIKP